MIYQLKKFTQKEREEYFSCKWKHEYTLIELYGEEMKSFLCNICDGREKVLLKKIKKTVYLRYSLVKEIETNEERISFQREDFYMIKAFIEGKEIGRCVYKIAPDWLQLKYIGLIDDKIQGNGVGTLLLKRIENIAKNVKAKRIEGIFQPVGDLGEFAEKFYLKNGYKITTDLINSVTYVEKDLELSKSNQTWCNEK